MAETTVWVQEFGGGHRVVRNGSVVKTFYGDGSEEKAEAYLKTIQNSHFEAGRMRAQNALAEKFGNAFGMKPIEAMALAAKLAPILGMSKYDVGAKYSDKELMELAEKHGIRIPYRQHDAPARP